MGLHGEYTDYLNLANARFARADARTQHSGALIYVLFQFATQK